MQRRAGARQSGCAPQSAVRASSSTHSAGLLRPQQTPRPGTRHVRCRTSCQPCPSMFNFSMHITLSCVVAGSQTKVALSAKLILLLHIRQTPDSVLCTSRGGIELTCVAPARFTSSVIHSLLPGCFCQPSNIDYSGCKEEAFSSHQWGR